MKCLVGFPFLLVSTVPALVSAGTPVSKLACSIEDFSVLKRVDVSELDKEDLTLLDQSTEGAGIEVYRREGTLLVIKTVFYGELGKTSFRFYFSPNDPEYYSVQLTEHHYTGHVMSGDVKTASTSRYDFVVCGKEETGFLTSEEVESARTKARDILEIIKAELK